jgi:predicted lactoylglutathione lyase
MNKPARQIECTIPVLPVRDLKASIRFYTEVLEFKVDWGDFEGSTVSSVSRDRCSIMLTQVNEKAGGVWVWIGLEDDSLFGICKERGVKVRQEPRNFSWAYEMKFEDPDGNVLWLGTEPRKNMPMEDAPGA